MLSKFGRERKRGEEEGKGGVAVREGQGWKSALMRYIPGPEHTLNTNPSAAMCCQK